MRIALTTSFLVALSMMAWAFIDEGIESRPCLNYWAVGDAKACDSPHKKPKKKMDNQKPVSPTAAAEPPPSPLDEKVDKFIAEHGKPPREFVKFYLDPTPEHAIGWVAKYNEILDRGQEMTLAWTQAEKLYEDKIKAGATPESLNPNPMAKVPDFGVPIPGFNTPVFAQMGMGEVKANIVPANLNTLAPPPPASATGLIKPVADDQPFEGKPLEVSYYFSAVCPYCKKFEPVFSQLVDELDGRLRVTCVDVTPETAGRERTPDNVGSGLACEWRAGTSEEITKLHIQQTPSLVINRGDDKPLEMISGYVEPDVLKNFFLTATQ